MKGWTTFALITSLAAGSRGINHRLPEARNASDRSITPAASGSQELRIRSGENTHRSRATDLASKRTLYRSSRSRSHRLANEPKKSRPSGVVYSKKSVGSTTAHVVSVDLNRSDIHVTVRVARGGIGCSESWTRIIDRLQPTAAITGTYYDPATLVPVGTIIADGVVHQPGTVGTALTLTSQNRCQFVRGRLPLARAGLSTTLRAGPRLLDEGHVSLCPYAEGFKDPGIMVRKPRAAVGLTKGNRLLLVTVTKPLFLREMAQVMRALGAENAMCMDGGSSTGLYYGGKSYQVPQRVMTNVLVVYAGTTPRAGSSYEEGVATTKSNGGFTKATRSS